MQSRLKFRPFIMVFGLILALVLLPLLLNMRTKAANTKVTTSYSQASFIKEVAPVAQKLSKAYGVKASVLIAQGAQSTDYGSNLLAVRYHNYLGVLAQPGDPKIVLTTQSYEKGKWQTVKQPYKIYKDWQDSLYDIWRKLVQAIGASSSTQLWLLQKNIRRLLVPCKRQGWTLTLSMPTN